jgi:hypothetical protein
VEPIPDKEDSTKIRSFCFVEFFDHKQAQLAYAACHLEAQSPPVSSSAPHSTLSESLDDAYSAAAASADGDDSIEHSSSTSTTSAANAAAAAAGAAKSVEDVLQGSRHSSDGTAAAASAVQCEDGAVTDTGPASLSPSRRPTLTATSTIITTAAPAAAAAAAAPAVATGPTAPSTVSTAVPLVIDGVLLKVDWADPLRYHIHLHGGIKGPREQDDSVERAPHRSSIRDQHSGYYRDAGGWPSSHPPRYREQQYYGQQQAQAQQQQRRQQQQMLQYGHNFVQQQQQQQQWPRQPQLQQQQQHGMYSQQQPQYAQQQQQQQGRPPAGPGGYSSGSYGSGGYSGLDEAMSAHLLMQHQLQQQVVTVANCSCSTMCRVIVSVLLVYCTVL